MQRGRGERDGFFGFSDPFASFGDPFGGSGDSFTRFGRPGNMISSLFGGRDPFDDPFFSRPFGSLMGPSMFGSRGSPFGESSNAGFIEQGALGISKVPIIQELNSDEEIEEGNTHMKEKKHHPRSNQVYIEGPDEETEAKKSQHVQHSNDFNIKANTAEPQAHTYSFHSKTVTYGGCNGAYYTSSTTRRSGGDGVTVEENKEADTTTGKATHKISRGIHDKGHSVTRKLNSDGRVETLQTLHNLNEDELTGFEEAWKGNSKQHLPGWNQSFDTLYNVNNRRPGPAGGEWALPSTEQWGRKNY